MVASCGQHAARMTHVIGTASQKVQRHLYPGVGLHCTALPNASQCKPMQANASQRYPGPPGTAL